MRDRIPAQTVTPKKLWKICLAMRQGKRIKLEINMVPIILMPSTIVTALKNAISMLKPDTGSPVALAKFSSKVIANIL